MEISYQQVMDDLKAIKPLPHGYGMECTDGDNILVNGPSHGFVLTKESILDNLHLAQYPIMLDDLVAIESGRNDE